MRGLAVGCGALLLLVAALLGLGYVAALVLALGGTADNAVLLGSAALMAGVMGAALVYAGANGGLQAARRRFGPRAPVWWLLLFVGVLVAGSLAIAAGPVAIAVLLPPLQFLAALLPALVVVGAAARSRGGADWRGTLVGLAYGGCGATTIALIVESVIGLILLAVIVASPDGQAIVAGLQDAMAALPGEGTTPDDLVGLLAPVLVPAVVASLFLLLGILGPLAEELAKALGVALADPPGAGRAWLWGVTVGAGFGIAEALTFGSMAVGWPAWPQHMAVRAITTVMHATMGGLGGLGVYWLLVERRRVRGLGLLLLAWIGHAAWNSAVLLTTLAGLLATGDGAGLAVPAAAAGTFGVIVLFGLVLITFRVMSRAAATPAASTAIVAATPPQPPAGPVDESPTIEDAFLPSPAVGQEDEAAAPAVPAPDAPPDDTAAGIPGLGLDVDWPGDPSVPDDGGPQGPPAAD